MGASKRDLVKGAINLNLGNGHVIWLSDDGEMLYRKPSGYKFSERDTVVQLGMNYFKIGDSFGEHFIGSSGNRFSGLRRIFSTGERGIAAVDPCTFLRAVGFTLDNSYGVFREAFDVVVCLFYFIGRIKFSHFRNIIKVIDKDMTRNGCTSDEDFIMLHGYPHEFNIQNDYIANALSAFSCTTRVQKNQVILPSNTRAGKGAIVQNVFSISFCNVYGLAAQSASLWSSDNEIGLFDISCYKDHFNPEYANIAPEIFLRAIGFTIDTLQDLDRALYIVAFLFSFIWCTDINSLRRVVKAIEAAIKDSGSIEFY